MKQIQHSCSKILSILKSATISEGNKLFLKKDLKGFSYAECKPFSAACLVNIIAKKGSEIQIQNPRTSKIESSIEDYLETASCRRIKVSEIFVHSVVLLPNVAITPRNFITFSDNKIIADFTKFVSGKNIEYAHSSMGDLYIKNITKTCKLENGFTFYFNASDVILTALQRS